MIFPRSLFRPTATTGVMLLMIVGPWMVTSHLIRGESETPTGSDVADFSSDVYPILRRSCFECHGAERQEGGLRLDTRSEALESGSIEPGDAESSELIRRIRLPHLDDEVMPAIGDPLSPREIEQLTRWVRSGAEWPDNFRAAKHWSYVKPERPLIPGDADQEWGKSPIDFFSLRKMKQRGLMPSAPASPEKLIRRVYLDLIGLPPSPDEVRQYSENPTEQNFRGIVDALLQRPQFGERWARPWLDLARYADSHGFQRDNLRDNWAYRDWVIRAFNDDMPFDQFTIEQIAGDLLPDATESQKIATGFHRCAPTNVEAGSLPEETRVEQIFDRVNTTGSIWLGSTLECCQCHDHKYDPFTTREYYKLFAFYNSTELEADLTDRKKPSSIQFRGPMMDLSDPKLEAKRQQLDKRIGNAKKRVAERRKILSKGLQQYASRIKEQASQSPQIHPLDIVSFSSNGTTDRWESLDDGSIRIVGGDPPDKDRYQIKVRGELSQIRGIRLDALRDDKLPGGGPGRGDPKRRNFVLTEFAAVSVPSNTDSSRADLGVAGQSGNDVDQRPLKFVTATASFSQKNWDVTGALTPGSKTGWAIAPQFDDSHWAVFHLAKPQDLDGSSEWVFTLDHQWGQARSIGRIKLSAITGDLNKASLSADLVAAVKKRQDLWTAKEKRLIVSHRAESDSETQREKARLAELETDLKQLAPDTTLVMVELDKPRESRVLLRGDYKSPGEAVTPGTPAVLHSLQVDGQVDGQGRLALARWLVDPENPLVARVAVNRWWSELFGQGLVTTPEDFGIKGSSPSHPELLDWLAVEFVENGWSLKHLLKTIVSSSTYQQSSRVTELLREVDDKNRWLSRGSRFRMDAEMIRDNALSISGLLDLSQFGPPIRPYQPDGIWKKVGGTSYQYEVSPGGEANRRGVYVVLKRGSPYPSFMNFDATPRLACTVKRSRTNTPLQALTLLNDPVYVNAARSLATRIRETLPEASLEEQIDLGFQLCTARSPRADERQALLDLYLGQVSAKRSEHPGSDSAQLENDAWNDVATVLLNLHETYTKD